MCSSYRCCWLPTYCFCSWKPWDFCAGLVIAEEAGCVMEAIDQKQRGPFDIYSTSHICATSQELLEEVRKLVQN
mgnify:CR=1 FL=1